MKDLLLVCPPFTQLNTPYPATAYLKGFLNTKDISSYQMDLGIEVILALFSRDGLEAIFEKAIASRADWSENSQRIYALRQHYLRCIDDVIAYLQGKRPSIARQLCTAGFLPRASRFEQIQDLEWAFGNMGVQDQAKHFATLFVEDLSDFIIDCIDPEFGFSRYAERLGMSANSFDELYAAMQSEMSLIDRMSLDLLQVQIEAHQPKLVCFTVPFPGNLYSAFRCAQFIRKHYPAIKVAMGGGFPNTELRELKDVRVFEFFHYITLDDGELPIELLSKQVLSAETESIALKRSYYLKAGEVYYDNSAVLSDYKQAQVGCPDYSDLRLDEYISVIEMANPMHSLWSDGRWNKLTMAHGCYWAKCTFCDISLDYIKLYEPLTAKLLADRMETIMKQTAESGFHFVDEAAPPALMKALALEILKRGLVVTWWANIRFEKSFDQDLCFLLKASGCIAVSGGLEVASDRLLKLIDKGVTVKQVAEVTRNFRVADIMVHSYLMYGYPTQTVQETVDSLEMVRQLFEADVLRSGFWHQFALTAHSPIGKAPADYGIIPDAVDVQFAHNDINYTDATGIDHSQFSFGLRKSLYNFMHGIGFDMELSDWFDFEIPPTTISPDYIRTCLEDQEYHSMRMNASVLWLGEIGAVETYVKKKRNRTFHMSSIQIHGLDDALKLKLDEADAQWLLDILPRCAVHADATTRLLDMKESYEQSSEHFELFWASNAITELRDAGLLLVL